MTTKTPLKTQARQPVALGSYARNDGVTSTQKWFFGWM